MKELILVGLLVGTFQDEVCFKESDVIPVCSLGCREKNFEWTNQLIIDVMQKTVRCICNKEGKKVDNE